MKWNDHSRLQGQHAFLGASKYHWLNYDTARIAEAYVNFQAKERGTRLHAYAAESIALGQKFPRSKKTLNSYVNDAIGFQMSPEVVLYYSENCYGIFPRDLDSLEDGSYPFIGAYSNCDSVELFINGTSCGVKTQAEIGDKYQFSWWGKVKYTAGAVLTAKGYDADGAVAATDEVKTSDGTPARLALTAYKPAVDVTTDDLVFVTCEIQDKDGVPVPTASNTVTFTCTGGTVLGTDNGNAACVENMRSPVRSAFSGKCLCVCRHDGQTGELMVTASADGLTGASVTVTKE